MTSQQGDYLSTLAVLLAGLLFFNYWFTVNRLLITARIVAYIQVVLEGEIQWQGWETSLRKYRIWIKHDHNAKVERVERELNDGTLPESFMYFIPIYLIHITLFLFCLGLVGALTFFRTTPINLIALLALGFLGIFFAQYCNKWRPSKFRTLIEREIIIWQYVLGVKHF